MNRHAAAGTLALSTLTALAGCHTVGPDSIRGGRSLYSEAIAVTTTEQLLLNLVRLRYRESPVFLEVTSVSTAFTLRSSAGTGGVFGFGSTPAENEFNINAGVSFDERPTVTYLPLQGEDFAVRLLTPIRPERLVLLANSGWAIDRILGVCVQQVGPLINATSASGPTPTLAPRFEGFLEFASALRELQREHAISLSVIGDESGGDKDMLGITIPTEAVGTPAFERAAGLIGPEFFRRNGDSSRTLICAFRASAGGPEDPSKGVPMVTRSVMSAMFYLSQGIDVPPEDEEAGLVTVTRTADGEVFEWDTLLGGVFGMQSGSRPPETAGPAVRYRGRWYWIDRADLTSKSTIGMMQQLLALQAGDIEGAGPLLTLPLTD